MDPLSSEISTYVCIFAFVVRNFQFHSRPKIFIYDFVVDFSEHIKSSAHKWPKA